MGIEEGTQIINAEAPQGELARYSAELRSMTAGEGTVQMEFARYDIVPGNIADKIVAAAAREKEEDE